MLNSHKLSGLMNMRKTNIFLYAWFLINFICLFVILQVL